MLTELMADLFADDDVVEVDEGFDVVVDLDVDDVVAVEEEIGRCSILTRFSFPPALTVNQSVRFEELLLESTLTVNLFPFDVRCPQEAVVVPMDHGSLDVTVIV
jgi:hypothetical protein